MATRPESAWPRQICALHKRAFRGARDLCIVAAPGRFERMYIGDWMARGARYWPDKVAVVDRGERFSYAQMNRRADDLARWLRADGVVRGDRVALLAMNGVEALDLLFACAKLGAVFVPLNWRSHWRELAAVLALTGPKVLVHGDEFAEAARELQRERPELRWMHLGAPVVPGSVAYAQALAGPGEPVSNPAVDAEDIVCLLFTGGTTGTPKAAQISYRMIAWNTLNTLVHEVARGDVTLTHTPMFHTGGLFVYTLPLLTVGGTVVIMRKWTAEEMLALIERERVTLLFCVPTQYQMMLDAPALRPDLVRVGPLPHQRRRPAARPDRARLPRGPRGRVQAGLRHDRVRARHLLDAAGSGRGEGRQHRSAQLLHRREGGRRGRRRGRSRRGR
jgi:acyl-CoA synthetase (AMP-forming)/AMP-acid ligase II